MQVLLYQLDGKLPNLALMRIAAHHRARGDEVELRHAGNAAALEPELGQPAPARVYASAIFQRTRPLAERLVEIYPEAVIGGTGWDLARTLDEVGIETAGPLDYSLYPGFKQSLGFTQRGCRLKCSFCVVPRKEGGIRSEASVEQIWRGEASASGATASPSSAPGRSRSRSTKASTRGFSTTRLPPQSPASTTATIR